LFELYRRYGLEFPRGTRRRDTIPTPIVCACEKGRMNDVELFINLHRFHKYIEMNGVKEGNMTLKEYVSQVGKNSDGWVGWTPLMAAAKSEHFQIVKYLIEQGEADPNIANSYGQNALHLAALNNEKDTKVIELLLSNMSLTSINKKGYGVTPLDCAYDNDSPLQQEIIGLIRSKGGKQGGNE